MIHLVCLGRAFTVDAKNFASLYLILHGVVKVALLYLLWRNIIWAYPIAIALPGFFIAVQVQRFVADQALLLIFLTLLAVLMMVLTSLEYRNLNRSRPGG